MDNHKKLEIISPKHKETSPDYSKPFNELTDPKNIKKKKRDTKKLNVKDLIVFKGKKEPNIQKYDDNNIERPKVKEEIDLFYNIENFTRSWVYYIEISNLETNRLAIAKPIIENSYDYKEILTRHGTIEDFNEIVVLSRISWGKVLIVTYKFKPDAIKCKEMLTGFFKIIQFVEDDTNFEIHNEERPNFSIDQIGDISEDVQKNKSPYLDFPQMPVDSIIYPVTPSVSNKQISNNPLSIPINNDSLANHLKSNPIYVEEDRLRNNLSILNINKSAYNSMNDLNVYRSANDHRSVISGISEGDDIFSKPPSNINQIDNRSHDKSGSYRVLNEVPPENLESHKEKRSSTYQSNALINDIQSFCNEYNSNRDEVSDLSS